MYSGKFSKKRKKKKLHPRNIGMVAFLLIMLGSAIIGGTAAYLMSNTNQLTNTFSLATVSIDPDEKFDGETKSNVRFRNTGTTDAFIRATYVVTWQDDAGNVYPQMPAAGVDYAVSINGIDWTVGPGGFYYHKAPVAPNKYTSVLINTCSPVKANAPAGYHLDVTVIASAIQSTPAEAVRDAWGVTVTGGQIG